MAHSVAMSRESAEPTSETETTPDKPLGEEESTTGDSVGEGEEEDSGVPTSKQRRAAAKRKLERQLERRAQQARRNRILTIAALVVVIAALAGVAAWLVFFNKDKPTSANSAAQSPVSSLPDTPPGDAGVLPPFKPPADLGANCTYPATGFPASKQVDPPRSGKVPTSEKQTSVSITTNQGPLGLHLNNAQAPCTVNSFASLAQKGYFNDTHCHRLTTGPKLSVLQCGDPAGDGKGGPGYQFANEYPTNQYVPDDPVLNNPVIYPRGTLAMANTGQPSSNGSQFFLVYKDSQLPPTYTVFGTIDEKDMATLDKIAAGGTVDGAPDGKPKTDVTITSARVD
jgi:peptidyl-prolyl cis-trans isomerase B (cyclophilin B)